jgi:hypothetical protein
MSVGLGQFSRTSGHQFLQLIAALLQGGFGLFEDGNIDQGGLKVHDLGQRIFHDHAFDGHVAKVAFQRYGSEVEYVRDQLTAIAPKSECTAIC